jgi:hypothetical protein
VAPYPFDEVLDTDQGWAKENRHYWLRDWRGYLEWFFSQCFTELHSTKQIEDCVGWGLDTDAQTILAGFRGWATKELDPETVVDLCARVRCPTLVLQGTQDELVDPGWGVALAAELGSPLIMLEGSGHGPHARDPVRTNLLLRGFADRVAPSAGSRQLRWTRALQRRRRALYLSSPIGLGHARRDIAIARELRELHPDLEVDWLAQDPVTRLLEEGGERIHPASKLLANESAHIESESAEHDLNCFQAIRRMDEILVANFMVFHEVVADGGYDLVVGDEAWDVDYYWHENPELKRTAFGWMTDFVGWVPMPDGGEREAFLTADYNAEMIQQVARFPRVRDRAVFVGSPDDIVPLNFGPGLPAIREWTEQHYAFAGYVTGFDPATLGDRQELCERLGWRPEERVVVVTVGGSGVGLALLRRVVASFPEAARQVDGLRMIASGRSAHRPWLAAGPGRGGGARSRPRPVPPAGRLRPGRGPGRPLHHHGAGRLPPPLPVLPVAQPLRAEHPRRPPAGPLPRRPAHGLRHRHPRGNSRHNRRRGRPPGRLPPGRDRRRRPRRRPARRAAVAVSEDRRHCCIWRSLPSTSSTRALNAPRRCSGLIALSTSYSRPDGKRLHFAIPRRRLRARCKSAPRRVAARITHYLAC